MKNRLFGWGRAGAIGLLALSSAMAQSGKGTITGRITDSAGGVLQGARIDLEPGGASGISDNLGQFTINSVTPGAYKLTVAFVGMAPSTTDVTVAAGETAHADATLQVATQNEEVLVTAERVHGEAEAINRERTAPNILQVLVSEVITSLPNANVADAIGRLPSVTLERDEGEGKYVQIRGTEPRYSNVTIDGVNVPSPEGGVRQIKLDIIPSDLVESVEINKTLQANQDGDAIGGSVNLRTKTAGEQPTLSVFGLGGYNPIIGGRGNDQFGGTLGKRFGREKRLGALFGGTYDFNGRGINDIEPSPTTIALGNSTTPLATYNAIDLRDYKYYRERFGFEGSVDYKLNDNSYFYARALYSHFNNFGDRWVYSPSINSFTTSQFQGGSDGNITANAEIRRPVEQIGSLLIGGSHVQATSSLTWDLSVSRSSQVDKGYSTTSFGPVADSSPLNNIQYGVDLANPYRPKLVVQNGVNVYDPSQYFLQGLDFNRSRSAHLNLQGNVTYGKSYSWNGHFGTFMIGGKVRNAHKYNEANDFLYDASNPGSLPMTQFLGTFTDSNYYGKSYTEGPFADYDKIRSVFNSNPAAFTLNFNRTRQSNDRRNYDLVERVSSGFFMNTITFGKFRLYGGLRFEGTNEDVLGYQVQFSGGNYVSTSPLRKNGGYTDPLPSAELRYALTPDSGIRFAYGRGIARPNFGDLVPYLSLNIAGTRNTASVGNPNLKATHANNYDVLFEQYLKPLGLIQAGFFYKDISDPIYFVQTKNVTYPGFTQNFIQTGPINGSSAHLWGFEVAYEQRLSYFPGALNSLGISANYSFTSSRANGLPNRSDHPSLQRQAPHTWNVSPTYDRGRVSLRVGVSYNAANIFFYNYTDGADLGLKGPNGDNYLYAHLQVDAQGSVRLIKGLSAIVYGLNLNNEVFGFYQGSPIWVVQREYYRSTYAAGLRWTSAVER